MTDPVPIADILARAPRVVRTSEAQFTYCGVGKPDLHWIAELGFAVFNGGVRARLADWDAFERGFLSDFAVYPRGYEMPVLDGRSMELGRQAFTQSMCRYQPIDHTPPPPAQASRRTYGGL